MEGEGKAKKKKYRSFFGNSIPHDRIADIVDIGWLLDKYGKGTDVADKYYPALEKVEKGESPVNIEKAKNFQYLLIPGFLGNHVPLYLHSVLTRLQQLKLIATKASIQTSNTTITNSKLLVAKIEKLHNTHKKKIIIICHSKGGLDTLGAIFMKPEIQEMLEIIITLQTPFGGVPMAAEYTEAKNFKKNILALVASVVGVKGDSVKCMTYKHLKQWYEDNESIALNLRVPIFCICTKIIKGHAGLYNQAWRYILKSFGAENDGLVTVRDSIFPKSRYVIVSGVSHAGTVQPTVVASSLHASDHMCEAALAVVFDSMEKGGNKSSSGDDRKEIVENTEVVGETKENINEGQDEESNEGSVEISIKP